MVRHRLGRRWLGAGLAALLVLGGAGGTLGVSTATQVSVGIQVQTQDPGEALLLGAAAAFFGLDTDVVLSFRQRTGSVPATLSTLYVAGEAGRAPDLIVRERYSSGGNWEVLVERYGVARPVKAPRGRAAHFFWTGRERDDDFALQTTVWVLAEYYAVSPVFIVEWADRGLPLTDIAIALNLARRVRVEPTTILVLRQKGHGWESIARRYHVTVVDLRRPVPPARKYGKVIVVAGQHGPKPGHGPKGKGKGH